MTVHVRSLRGDPVDVGDGDAEGEKYKYGQTKIERMVERHNCAPLIDAGLGKRNRHGGAGFDPDQNPAREVNG